MEFQVRNEIALKRWVVVKCLKIDSESLYEAVNDISDFSNDTLCIAGKKGKECFHPPKCRVHR